jgi:hypothetical protein
MGDVSEGLAFGNVGIVSCSIRPCPAHRSLLESLSAPVIPFLRDSSLLMPSSLSPDEAKPHKFLSD